MDVNKVILIGRLTNDPVNKKLDSGISVAYCGLATNLFWKNSKTKKTENRVEFHNLVFWRSLADITEKYMKKGDKVYIEGRLQTRTWDDDKKVKHYKTEVVVKEMIMLGGKKKEESNKEMAVEEVVIEEEK
jgi:single-strand DNA-binding protein